MAINAVGTDISFVAGADLSAKQFCGVKINSAGQLVAANATDLNQVGILQDKSTSGQTAQVRYDGISKAKAGATVAAGDRVTTDANGAFVTATTGKQVMGIALTGGAVNDVITVMLSQRGVA
jgi:hypothetical protein